MKFSEGHLDQVVMNKHGFFEIKNKPTSEELSKFYSDKYFQENNGPYQTSYTEKEILWFNNKIEQKYLSILEIFKKNNIPVDNLSLLDIGCGEGWTLKYFSERGWNVTGLDYSDFAMKNLNPDCLQHLVKGDIYENMRSLMQQEKKYDVIWMTNVLEHVPDTESILVESAKLVTRQGILLVQVPNDFSELQAHLLNNGFIDKPYWIAPPDHLSYFSINSLVNLMKYTGWEKEKIQTDFPIDWNLFNENTNYYRNKKTGKSVHFARIEIENFLHQIDPEKTNEFYELLAEMNIGRQIIGYFSLKNSH